jgi:hypothetical protein
MVPISPLVLKGYPAHPAERYIDAGCGQERGVEDPARVSTKTTSPCLQRNIVGKGGSAGQSRAVERITANLVLAFRETGHHVFEGELRGGRFSQLLPRLIPLPDHPPYRGQSA